MREYMDDSCLTTDQSHSPPPLMGSPGDGTQRGLWVSHRMGLPPVVGASPTTLPCISHNSWNVLSDKVPEAEYLLITGALTVTAMKTQSYVTFFSGCSSHYDTKENWGMGLRVTAKGMRW